MISIEKDDPAIALYYTSAINTCKADMLPDPGSHDAVRQGCTCPVIDNNHGKGFPFGDDLDSVAFVMTADCPLHFPFYQRQEG